jgi:hypothetical protein
MAAKLDVTITPEARNRAVTLLANTDVRDPTLCLMKGRTLGESEDRWGWGIYGPDNIKFLKPNLALRGHTLLYELDGLTVAIPQFNFVPELVGKTLGVSDRGLVVSPPANGA